MVWVDVTTLLNWNRPPVGIVRTDAEFVRYQLTHREQLPEVKYFCWNWQREEVVEVPVEVVEEWFREPKIFEQFRVPMRVSFPGELPPSDPIQIKERSRRYRHPFKQGDRVLSIGLDWEYIEYPLLYFWKQELGLQVGGVVYDLIPILYQHFFPNRRLGQLFLRHLVDLLHTADKLFTISRAVEQELRGYIREHRLPEPEIKTVYLGDSVVSGEEEGEERERPHNRENFILYVSTIDSRKNHLILLHAYNLLLADGYTPPDLVFVGMGADALPKVEEYLQLYPYLRRFVHIYTDVENPELLSLYRQAKFTLFPSKVEGWGLGSRESLLFQKPVLISKTPALVEATEGLMPALPADDPFYWAEGIKLMDQPEVLAQFKEIIAQQFQPRSWEEFGRELWQFYLS